MVADPRNDKGAQVRPASGLLRVGVILAKTMRFARSPFYTTAAVLRDAQ